MNQDINSEHVVTTSAPADKVVIFRFYRGPRDGQDLRSDDQISPRNRLNEALMYWLSTSNGDVGVQFATLSPRAMDMLFAEEYEIARQRSGGQLRKYRYEVVDRVERPGEIVVVCDFRNTQ